MPKNVLTPNLLTRSLKQLETDPTLQTVFAIDTCGLSSSSGEFRGNHWKLKRAGVVRKVSVYTYPTKPEDASDINRFVSATVKSYASGIAEELREVDEKVTPAHMRFFQHIGQAAIVEQAVITQLSASAVLSNGEYGFQEFTTKPEYVSLGEYLDIYVLSSLAGALKAIKLRENVLPTDPFEFAARIFGGAHKSDSPLMPGKSMYVDGSARYYGGSEDSDGD